MFGALPFISAGLQAGGGIADFMERRREADIVNTQKKLALSSSRRDERQMVGRQVANTGAAGVKMTGTTLDKILQTHTQFALDQEIIKASAALEQDSLKRQGIQDLLGGFAGGLKTLAPTLMKASPTQSPLTQKPMLASAKTNQGMGMPWMMMGGVKS